MKQSSNFFLCGTDTDISLISRRTSSVDGSVPFALPGPAPFAPAPSSTRRLFAAGSELVWSWSCTKLAMLLNSVTLAGESGILLVTATTTRDRKDGGAGTGGCFDALQNVGAGLEDEAEPLGVQSGGHLEYGEVEGSRRGSIG